MANKKKITECPHCRSKEGFYILSDYIGVPYKHGYNGEEKDNSEMFNNPDKYHTHRYAYCIDCYKVVGTAYALAKQIQEQGTITENNQNKKRMNMRISTKRRVVLKVLLDALNKTVGGDMDDIIRAENELKNHMPKIGIYLEYSDYTNRWYFADRKGNEIELG